MALLKKYQTLVAHLYDTRAVNILKEDRSQCEYLVLVVAESKEQAAHYCKDRGARTVDARDLRLLHPGVPTLDAILEAGLLQGDGTVLITSMRGGANPVVLMDPEEGAQAIGVLKPTGDRVGGKHFEAVTAHYAMKGSLAAGADEVVINTGRPGRYRWRSSEGISYSDGELQVRLDLGDLKIIRSGYGEWYHAGR